MKSGTVIKNNDTRESLIQAGLELFGDYGLEGTSTRMLAKTAGANISGIAYYFGGKDGLYRAVLEHISRRFNDLTEETRGEIRLKLSRPMARPEALSLIKEMVSMMSRIINDQLKIKNAEKIILREQTDPSPAFSILFDGYMRELLSLIFNLASRYSGQPADSDEVIVMAHTLFGQVISFVATKETLFKNLGVKRLSGEQKELIRRVVPANVEASLKAWVGEGEQV